MAYLVAVKLVLLLRLSLRRRLCSRLALEYYDRASGYNVTNSLYLGCHPDLSF